MTLVVGLTGGIGSGKSTVASLLEARGAAIVDADVIARALIATGGPAYDAVVARFGDRLLFPDGSIDRAALARVVFSDDRERLDLEAILHPMVRREMAERIASLRRPDAGTDAGAGGGAGAGAEVVVAVVPLLTTAHREELGIAAVVVVDCDPQVALGRLTDTRGMKEGDARARMAAQPGRTERLRMADYVVDNSGTREQLEGALDALWRWLGTLRA